MRTFAPKFQENNPMRYLSILFCNALKCRLLLPITILLSLLLQPSTLHSFPKYEVRAVWLATIGGIDWPRSANAATQKEELRQMLDQLRRAGINTVLFQARVRATTVYPSALEPWDVCINGGQKRGATGTSPGYDPLRLCIDLCHERGMECHAWVVTLPVGKWNSQGCRLLRQKYTKLIKRIGEEGYMDPEQTATGEYLAQICREIVRGYDVDGIHLDYIRYPEKWKLKVSRQKGREHITDIVRRIHDAVKSEKPWVKMSCSPIGKHDDLRRYRSGGWNARTAVCQDAQEWLRMGLIDQLYPMMYFKGDNFFPFAIDWQENAYGRTVAGGLGIYFLDPREGQWTLDVVEREMNVLRQIGMGFCHFRSKFLCDNVKGIYDLTSRFCAVPALVPPMPQGTSTAPLPPTALQLNGHTLTWKDLSSSNLPSPSTPLQHLCLRRLSGGHKPCREPDSHTADENLGERDCRKDELRRHRHEPLRSGECPGTAAAQRRAGLHGTHYCRHSREVCANTTKFHPRC